MKDASITLDNTPPVHAGDTVTFTTEGPKQAVVNVVAYRDGLGIVSAETKAQDESFVVPSCDWVHAHLVTKGSHAPLASVSFEVA